MFTTDKFNERLCVILSMAHEINEYYCACKIDLILQ